MLETEGNEGRQSPVVTLTEVGAAERRKKKLSSWRDNVINVFGKCESTPRKKEFGTAPDGIPSNR